MRKLKITEMNRLTPEEFQNLLSSRLSPSGCRNPPEEDQDISQADNAGCVIKDWRT